MKRFILAVFCMTAAVAPAVAQVRRVPSPISFKPETARRRSTGFAPAERM